MADQPAAPIALTSHPKNSETGLFQGRVQSRAQAESQDQAGVGGIDDSVIPESVRTKEKHGSIDRRTAHYVPLGRKRPSITVTSGQFRAVGSDGRKASFLGARLAQMRVKPALLPHLALE